MRDSGLAEFDGSLGRDSPPTLERDELSDQLFEFVWQRLRQDREIVGVQLATDRGRCLAYASASFPT
jgi:hypothetical protein